MEGLLSVMVLTGLGFWLVFWFSSESLQSYILSESLKRIPYLPVLAAGILIIKFCSRFPTASGNFLGFEVEALPDADPQPLDPAFLMQKARGHTQRYLIGVVDAVIAAELVFGI